MKNNIMKFLSVIVFILGSVVCALAQPLPPDPATNGVVPGVTPTLSCPIGNGYWILLALAFSYGVYKTWQMRKAEKAA
jgi:hypothetical protein